jgi:hypothetical protein
VTLEPIPETWTRAFAVVAHPDDLEYGAASAIARWTTRGRSVGYVIVTDGEAGIDAIPPTEAAVLRQKEQLASAGSRTSGVVRRGRGTGFGWPRSTSRPGPGWRRPGVVRPGVGARRW